ncbi:MAG: hypothetical protein AUJ70_00755 [Candidatus Omnitrophica bacterium CG1_02_40_15]|nr:MAG: hypothetical protein AUJ70_00755 [Candidatus Omnitrophica bacterium CG1_02_40_15]
MGYEVALKKAWEAVQDTGIKQRYLKFLNDEYEIDYAEKNIISMSCNTLAKDYYKLLILHYIANENKVLNIGDDKWISFKEMDGGEAYFPAFKKRAVTPILRKYGNNSSSVFERCSSFNAEKIDAGTAAISISAFPKIKIAVILWAKDEEFSADCNMLFNPEIKEILPTEDAAVLGGIIASLI